MKPFNTFSQAKSSSTLSQNSSSSGNRFYDLRRRTGPIMPCPILIKTESLPADLQPSSPTPPAQNRNDEQVVPEVQAPPPAATPAASPTTPTNDQNIEQVQQDP